jgi:aminoglycoside phosphotransferase (APT) family kinase protein
MRHPSRPSSASRRDAKRVNRWIEGVTAAEAITDWGPIAQPLAQFLVALQRVDPRGGPPPGTHNFFRGASESTYSDETIAAIQTLGTEIDRAAAESVWCAATDTTWTPRPRWFHGDVSADNLITRRGRLCAVIDFGTSGVGDLACDTVIAWTHLDPTSREVCRRGLILDPASWARGRCWALWMALISPVRQLEPATMPGHSGRAVAVADGYKQGSADEGTWRCVEHLRAARMTRWRYRSTYDHALYETSRPH